MTKIQSDAGGPIARSAGQRRKERVDRVERNREMQARLEAEGDQRVERLLAITRRHAVGVDGDAQMAEAATGLRAQFDSEGTRMETYGVARKRLRDGGEMRAFRLLDEALLRRPASASTPSEQSPDSTPG